MYNSTIRAVVTDDDFMIARLHEKFINTLSMYRVVGTAANGAETLQVVQETDPDLLVLDVYLPDKSGLDVLRELRAREVSCDVILVTAAKEVQVVEDAFRLGIFDYLMKPFNLERLRGALEKYAQYRHSLYRQGAMSQEMVDNLRQMRASSSSTGVRHDTESGIDQRTLVRVRKALDDIGRPCVAEDVAEYAGVSRSTARNYLSYLVEQGLVFEELSYGSVGRPRRLFVVP